MRGVAAAVVVLHHCLITAPLGAQAVFAARAPHSAWSFWRYLPGYALVAGPEAVLLFFVLSGFVLGVSFDRVDRGSLVSYYAKRIPRLWVPLAATLLLIAAFILATHPRPVAGLAGWYATAWTGGVHGKSLVEHLLLTGRAINLDFPMWSLVEEIRVSLLFPGLFALVVWRPGLASAALALVSFAALEVQLDHHAHGLLGGQIAATLAYLFLFAWGVALCVHRRQLQSAAQSLHGAALWTAWLVSLVLLTLRFSTAASAPILQVLNMATGGVGACGLVALGMREGRAATALESGSLQWLGRISFSLYLLHVPVILAVVHLLGRLPNPFVLVLFVVPLSLAAAEAFCRTVELPSQALGRWLAHRLTTATATRGSGSSTGKGSPRRAPA